MNNFDLLTTNKFVEKGVYNLSTDQKKEDYLRKWRVTKYLTEPKTRKLVFEDGKPTYPLGWVKLELKNE